jgi:tRNA (guanine37-N1)-methyltransferase
MLQLSVITLMPEMFAALSTGITGRALKRELLKIDYWNPRDWGIGTHRQVDDKPYGGGPGMVMMYEPLHKAIQHAKKNMPSHAKTIYLSPQGKTVQQADFNKLAKEEQPLILLAGRYEGIDERIIQQDIDEEWSIGNFVLSGGELAAMVIIDAIVRLLPGSLGDPGSAKQDSFMEALLDHPQYTRPAEIQGLAVPKVLLDGNHREIRQWRRQQALGQTWLKRPELLEKVVLSKEEKDLLEAFKLSIDTQR